MYISINSYLFCIENKLILLHKCIHSTLWQCLTSVEKKTFDTETDVVIIELIHLKFNIHIFYCVTKRYTKRKIKCCS